MDIPVYLFTGFLESGKTTLIQQTLERPDFYENGNERQLVILCEEGEEGLDPLAFAAGGAASETLDGERQLNPDKLEALRRKHDATCVVLEYNGMWTLDKAYGALPEGWFIFQEVNVADSTMIEVFNANMRNLVVDKFTGCDLVIFNRCDGDTDFDALHKLVRGVSRRPDIVYENVDGSAAYDDIEDPLPFDMDAPVVEVGDSDYALFYRDLAENPPDWDGKTVRFLGQTNGLKNLPSGGFVIGRPVMTCCVEDITFSGLFSETGADRVKNGAWYRVTGKLTVKNCAVYGRVGPVMRLISAEEASAPEQPVSTFY